MLEGDVDSLAKNYSEKMAPGVASLEGKASLAADETSASKTKARFRFKVHLSDPDTRYQFSYPVRTTTTSATGASSSKVVQSCSVDGNGGETTTPVQTPLEDFSFPDAGATTTKTVDFSKVKPQTFSISGGGCSSCSGGDGGGTAGSGKSELDDPNLNLALGRNNAGLPVGSLLFNQSAPSLATPGLLQLLAVAEDVSVVTNNGALRQVLAAQMLVDIISNSPCQFDLNVYDVNNFSPVLSGGLYPVNANGQFLQWRIENPGGVDDTNHLQMVETRNGHAITNLFTWIAGGTIMTGGNGLETVQQQEFWDTNASTRMEAVTTFDANHTLVYASTNVYATVSGVENLVATVEGTGAAARTTTYAYVNGGQLQQVTYPDGTWESYNYDTNANLLQKSSANHRTTYGYTAWGAGDDGSFAAGEARSITNWFGGQVVGLSYRILTPGQRIEIQATSPNAAWNDPANLFTTNNYGADGRLASTILPDQTVRWYAYNFGPAGRTNFVYSGYWDGAAYATNQVTTTGYGPNGLILSATTIENGLLTAATYYTNYDTLGRVGLIRYLDGTSVSYQYDCCGVASSSDRNGLVTVNTYNALKQLTSKTEVGLGSTTWYYSYDPLGHLLSTKRVGDTVITLGSAAYDTAGHLLTATNALGGVTTYAEGLAGNNIFSRTTTNPDGGTRTEAYNADGTLASVAGSAAHGVHYVYGTGTDTNGNACTYTQEIKLLADGTDSLEWTTTFTDLAGRTTEVLYADGRCSRSFYNSKGQLAKQVNPDGVTTLYQYNARGELSYTAVAAAGAAAVDIDWNRDRITWTTNDVTSDHGTVVRRTRTYAWTQNGLNAPTLLSQSETSADGLGSWQVSFADDHTAVTNSTVTVISGSSRTVTTTAPDGSYSLSRYSYGRLLSATRYDAADHMIGGTTYNYDSHGRQYQVTDARNGATTYNYNAADQVSSVTTPAPGNGAAPQTIATLYDAMLRPYRVIQPDGTAVNTSYLLTGELASQSGSRTYPVAYGYDYAGRMKTMTNWSSFAGLAGARVTTWNYDGQRGWLTNKVYADGNGPSYAYTPAGRLASRAWVRLDGNGNPLTTAYAYDTTGNLVNILYSDATPAVTNIYDRLGRLAAVTCNGLTDTLSYNLANGLLAESFAGGALAGLAVTNGYDLFLRRTQLSAFAGDTRLLTANYGYDRASRLAGVNDGGNNSASYTYLANSPLVGQIAFTQGGVTRMTTTRQYDFLNRLTQVSSVPGAGGTMPLGFNYDYNAASQRTRNTLADGSSWRYQYDALGQVTGAAKYFTDGTPVPGQQFGYVFDDIGNRTQTQSGGDAVGTGLRPANYTNNLLNQITARDYPGTNDLLGAAFATNAVTVNGSPAWRKGEYFWATVAADNTAGAQWPGVTVASGGTTNAGNLLLAQTPQNFIYDTDGNLVSDGLWTNVWDAENRLVETESMAGVPEPARLKEEWSYLPDGRWSQRIVSVWDGGVYMPQTTNKFVWDGKVLVAIVDQNNNLLMSFMRGLDLSGSLQGAGGVGGLLAVNFPTNGTHFAAFDGNGNVAALVNAADGTLSANYEYGPFGEAIRVTGAVGRLNPIRFSTQFADEVTGRIKYLYREYTPSTGTWPNRDPIEENGGLNNYEIAGNDVLNKFDFLGLRLPTLAEANEHYRTANGQPLRISFDDIDTSSVKPLDFAVVQNALSKQNRVVGLGKCRVFEKNVDGKLGYNVPGAPGVGNLVLGDITLRLQAKVASKCDCSWTVKGTLKSYDDTRSLKKAV